MTVPNLPSDKTSGSLDVHYRYVTYLSHSVSEDADF
jgi:hypothetical protein